MVPSDEVQKKSDTIKTNTSFYERSYKKIITKNPEYEIGQKNINIFKDEINKRISIFDKKLNTESQNFPITPFDIDARLKEKKLFNDESEVRNFHDNFREISKVLKLSLESLSQRLNSEQSSLVKNASLSKALAYPGFTQYLVNEVTFNCLALNMDITQISLLTATGAFSKEVQKCCDKVKPADNIEHDGTILGTNENAVAVFKKIRSRIVLELLPTFLPMFKKLKDKAEQFIVVNAIAVIDDYLEKLDIKQRQEERQKEEELLKPSHALDVIAPPPSAAPLNSRPLTVLDVMRMSAVEIFDTFELVPPHLSGTETRVNMLPGFRSHLSNHRVMSGRREPAVVAGAGSVVAVDANPADALRLASAVRSTTRPSQTIVNSTSDI